jgi:peptide/nickel transport system permease protein
MAQARSIEFDQPLPTEEFEKEERVHVASQWRLTWWRFKKHRLAMASGMVLLAFYLVAFFADFLSTSTPDDSDALYGSAPPQPIHWIDGGRFAPYVHPIRGTRDLETLKRVYTSDESTKVPVQFFASGAEYLFLGLIPMSHHLLGVADGSGARLVLLGTDSQGRDLWTRLLHATRTSLSIGLVGVALIAIRPYRRARPSA